MYHDYEYENYNLFYHINTLYVIMWWYNDKICQLVRYALVRMPHMSLRYEFCFLCILFVATPSMVHRYSIIKLWQHKGLALLFLQADWQRIPVWVDLPKVKMCCLYVLIPVAYTEMYCEGLIPIPFTWWQMRAPYHLQLS